MCFQKIPALGLEGLEVAYLKTWEAARGGAGVEETGEVAVGIMRGLLVLCASGIVGKCEIAMRGSTVDCIFQLVWTLRAR